MNQLTALCIALHCTPNDLMEFEGKDQQLTADHPLKSLVRDTAAMESMEKLRKLPFDKIKQLQQMMDEI
jgi:hypothetical protein